MRVLVANDSISDTSLASFEVSHLNGVKNQGGNLFALDSVNMHDFDGLVVDMGTVENVSTRSGTLLNQPIIDLLNGGGVVVCFSSPRGSPSWLPIGLSFRDHAQGSRLTVIPGTPVSEILERFKDELSYECTFERPNNNNFNTVASTLDGWPIGLTAYNGRLLVLPRARRLDYFTSQLFTSVLPQVAPERFKASPRGRTEEAPPWSEPTNVPGVGELTERMTAVEAQMRELEIEKAELGAEREKLAAYADLLWARGKEHLEPLVRDALNLIGLPVAPEGLIDAVYRGEGGPLYIEIEGSDKNIDVQKGRQLLHYIAESEDIPTRGAVIGNPFRLHPPADRPPDSNSQLFSAPLVQLAENQRWALLTTVDLYELVCRHLGGDKSALGDLRSKLRL